MADGELMAVDAVASERAKSEAASAETARALKTVGTWVADFIDQPAPALPVLLALRTRRAGAEVLVAPQDAWMPAGRLGIVASPGGKGKTALLMHLAGHVAAGQTWCGLEVVRPGAVALVLGEEDLGECHRRLRRAWEQMSTQARQDAAARTLVLPLAGTGDNRLVRELPGGVEKSPRAEELVAYLQAAAPKDGWSLVVVDPFSRFSGMHAEVDNASATSTMAALEELTKLPGGPAVLVTHHTRKRGNEGGSGIDLVELVRGASAIKDAARWVAMLDADPSGEDGKGRAVLRVLKSNYTSTAFGLELETMYGAPTSGRPRLVAELDVADAEKKERTKSKPDPRAKAEGAGDRPGSRHD
jgi:hypothetical protein